MDRIDHIKTLLKNHKCRIDRRKPAGGGVCNICQADFALDNLKTEVTILSKREKEIIYFALSRLLDSLSSQIEFNELDNLRDKFKNNP